MKNSDKITGIVSIIIIISTIIYLLKTDLLFMAGKDSFYAFCGFLLLIFVLLYLNFFIRYLILKKRIKDFKNIAIKYSLKHSFVKNCFSPGYGKLNTLIGSINGHSIEVSDEYSEPKVEETIKFVIANSLSPKSNYGKKLNMGTQIFIDGTDCTPSYVKKLNPFFEIDKIKTYLSKL
jgi:hypothetical protein